MDGTRAAFLWIDQVGLGHVAGYLYDPSGLQRPSEGGYVDLGGGWYAVDYWN